MIVWLSLKLYRALRYSLARLLIILEKILMSNNFSFKQVRYV